MEWGGQLPHSREKQGAGGWQASTGFATRKIAVAPHPAPPLPSPPPNGA